MVVGNGDVIVLSQTMLLLFPPHSFDLSKIFAMASIAVSKQIQTKCTHFTVNESEHQLHDIKQSEFVLPIPSRFKTKIQHKRDGTIGRKRETKREKIIIN